eukprot:1518826-Prymnesium_polylepis.1
MDYRNISLSPHTFFMRSPAPAPRSPPRACLRAAPTTLAVFLPGSRNPSCGGKAALHAQKFAVIKGPMKQTRDGRTGRPRTPCLGTCIGRVVVGPTHANETAACSRRPTITASQHHSMCYSDLTPTMFEHRGVAPPITVTSH